MSKANKKPSKAKKDKKDIKNNGRRELGEASTSDNNFMDDNDGTPLFFVDDKPDENAFKQVKQNETTVDSNIDIDNGTNNDNHLTLPDHVNINNDDPDEINDNKVEVLGGDGDINSYNENNGDDYVDIDAERAPQRYFEDEKPKHEYTVCKSCKGTGHIAKDCPHIICLTCGAVDEHKEKNCPISLICFNCGGRSHFARNCPQPKTRDARLSCRRCGSPKHQTRNCPTLWRLYDYVDSQTFDNLSKPQQGQSEKDSAYIESQDKRTLFYCYNCAESGHLGDNCDKTRGCPIPLVELSAFSEENLYSGPYKHVRIGNESKSRKKELGNKVRDKVYGRVGYPSQARIPERGGVGFEKRRKEKESQRRVRDRYDDYYSDDDSYNDWFASYNERDSYKASNKRKNNRINDSYDDRYKSSSSRRRVNDVKKRSDDQYRSFKNLDRLPQSSNSKSTYKGGYGKRIR